ncbi:MAG TPA: dTMP kinase [Fibrobacteria bacterium]|nr:dTMP kinase [Fibrobacteria bacterium]
MSGVLPFFVFEGIDGAGKSTQVALLAEALEARGHEVTRVRDPGGTPLSDRIRGLLLDPESPVASSTELCLYAAARAQLVHEVVRPALDAGRIVISDRFTWSTRAYQGAGRGLSLEAIDAVAAVACGDLRPAHVFVLDLDPAAREARMTARAGAARDRLERESGAFFARVREGFLEQAAARPHEGTVLDAALPPGELHARVLRKVLDLLAAA